MIRIIRTSTLDRLRAHADLNNGAEDLRAEIRDMAAGIRNVAAEIKKVAAERDAALADLATIEKALGAGAIRFVPQQSAGGAVPSVPVLKPEAESRPFDHPQSAGPEFVIEHADRGCAQCIETVRSLSREGLERALGVANTNGLVIAGLLILGRLLKLEGEQA
ncbi:hypothetical protein [Streptomyces sp. NPDC087538]|uniref:hypothetical protein n=1 Tax=Streptomyces sp. NPDC087538 TaxID=3365797 RepID=UPI00380232DC